MAAGTLRANDKGLMDVVSRWDQLLRFAALRLGRELGTDVQVRTSRKDASDPGTRLASQAQKLVNSGVLDGALRIPDTVAPLEVCADLRAGKVTVTVDVDAPTDGRAATRVNWLLRQVSEAPPGIRLDALTTGARSSTSELLSTVRENPASLIIDKTREIRSFRIAATSPLGTKRGAGRGGFIDSVLATIDGFYETVVQNLRAWSPRAPQLPAPPHTAAEGAGIVLTPPPSERVNEDELSEAHEVTTTNGETPATEAELVAFPEAEDRLENERSRSHTLDGDDTPAPRVLQFGSPSDAAPAQD
jgi:hypothetical protein